MVKGLFQVYLPEKKNSWIYSCFYCRAHLAVHEDLISKSFQGSQGRAYLFNDVVNVHFGEVKQRVLLTGIHFVADVFCTGCRALLGWKYERALEPSQRYKEGKIIIELAHLIKDNFWDRDLYRSQYERNGQSFSYWLRPFQPSDPILYPGYSSLQENFPALLSCGLGADTNDSQAHAPPDAPAFGLVASSSSYMPQPLAVSQSTNQSDCHRSVLSSLNDNSVEPHFEQSSDTTPLISEKGNDNGTQASSSHSPIIQLINASKNGWRLRKRLHRRTKSSSPSLDKLLTSTAVDSDDDDNLTSEDQLPTLEPVAPPLDR